MNYQMIHSCIRVKDLAASEDFYQRAFGFEISRKRDFPEHKFTYNYDRSEPYQIGDGYSHLAVGVADLEASRARHEELGFNPGPIKGLGADGKGMFYFVSDPDGYFVEVVRQQG